jgi:hypothetical protein
MTDVSTATSTTTSTLTTTSTEFAPIATYYPACGSDNRVTSVDGRGIINGDVPNWYVTTQAASAYDCCVLCLQSQSCGATFYSRHMQSYNTSQRAHYQPWYGLLCGFERQLRQTWLRRSVDIGFGSRVLSTSPVNMSNRCCHTPKLLEQICCERKYLPVFFIIYAHMKLSFWSSKIIFSSS